MAQEKQETREEEVAVRTRFIGPYKILERNKDV